MPGFDIPTLEYPAIAELAAIAHWVVWKAVERDGKITKVPFSARTGKTASVNRPDTWATYQEACAMFALHDGFAGIGFVITEDIPYTVIDVDHCRNPQTGALTQDAQRMVRDLDSYTELSPSETGIHIWLKSKPPGESRKCSLGEIYRRDRYITVTGKLLDGAPDYINGSKVALARIYYELFPAKGTPAPDFGPALAVSDTELGRWIRLLEKDCVADASGPADKIALLLENDGDHFGRIWNDIGEHKDQHGKPWSQSEYDYSLTNFFARAGFTPVEAMHSLIEHRRTRGVADKVRPDYYARTLSGVYGELRLEHALVGVILKPARTPEERATFKARLAEVFGIEFRSMIKFRTDPPLYKIETQFGICQGNADMLTSQTKFRNAMVEAAGILIPVYKAGKWRDLSVMLIGGMEEMEAGAEGTDVGQVEAWISSYLEERPQAADDFDNEAVLSGNPFRRTDGFLYIVMADFGKYLRRSLGIQVPGKRLGVMLRSFGCVPDLANVYVDGRKSSRSCWRLPSNFRRKE